MHMRRAGVVLSCLLLIGHTGCRTTQQRVGSATGDLRAFAPKKCTYYVGERIPVSMLVANASEEHELFVHDYGVYLRYRYTAEGRECEGARKGVSRTCGSESYRRLHRNTLKEAGCCTLLVEPDDSQSLQYGCRSSYSVSAGEIGPFSEPRTVHVETRCRFTYLRLGSQREYSQELHLKYDIQILPEPVEK